MTFHCPCHGPEKRDPRFAELDALIAAGWGSCPSVAIEEIARRSGRLPSQPPPDFRDDDEQSAGAALILQRAETKNTMGLILQAVIDGYATARQIAAVLDMDIKTASANLSTLRRRGKIAIVGQADTPGGGKPTFFYAPVDGVQR